MLLCTIHIILWLHTLSVGVTSGRVSNNSSSIDSSSSCENNNDNINNNNRLEVFCDNKSMYHQVLMSELASMPTTGTDADDFERGSSEEQKDLATRTVRLLSLSWKSGTWTVLRNTGLVVLTAMITRWCSTAQMLESEEEEEEEPEEKEEEDRVVVPRAHNVQPRKVTKIEQKPPIMPHVEKDAEQRDANAITMSPPPVASQPASIISTGTTNTELVNLGMQNRLRLYNLETALGDTARAVEVRRQIVAGKVRSEQHPSSSSFNLHGLPYKEYDYSRVIGACCENVIGYTTVPVGVAGPLKMGAKQVFIPMATTEGALVAGMNRGCTAINASGGVVSLVLGDGMTRGPCVRFPNLERAGAAKMWLDTAAGFQTVEAAFNSTTRFGRLQSIRSVVAGSDVFVRFKAGTGDAMGMNMMSKGVEKALAAIHDAGFDDMRILSLSGNYCTDKKAAAINWIDGRGKSVAAQATISAETLKKVLKVDVDSMVELNSSKNLVGSCLAGSIGGFNAHAANTVAAIFLATGQDIAQVVESSSCLTTMQK